MIFTARNDTILIQLVKYLTVSVIHTALDILQVNMAVENKRV